MRCLHCDGELEQPSMAKRFQTSLAIAKTALSKSKDSMLRRPRSKRKRIQKKWEKRFNRVAAQIALIGMPLVGRNYRCNKCGKTEGFYSAIGRNLFPIQQMGPGALLIYDRDPEVAKLL